MSGSRTLKTMPPAKMPTAIFVMMYATREIRDRNHRAVSEKRRSRNSGIVKTRERT